MSSVFERLVKCCTALPLIKPHNYYDSQNYIQIYKSSEFNTAVIKKPLLQQVGQHTIRASAEYLPVLLLPQVCIYSATLHRKVP